MNFFEAVQSRGSYRGEFLSDEIPREDLERIVDAGIRAPSGYNSQSTSFIVVTDNELKKQISECMGRRKVVDTARAILVVLMRPEKAEGKDYAFGVEDYAAAVENMLLAITALGYASVWIDGALRREGIAARIASLLAVEKGLEVRVILPVGVPKDEVRQNNRQPLSQRCKFL